MQFVAYVCWASLDNNLFGVTSPELGARCIHNDMCLWYERCQIPLNMRIGQLTPSMLGSTNSRTIKTKAGETGILLKWAVDLCRRKRDRMPHGDVLVAAGETLLEFLALLKRSPRVPSKATCDTLISLAVRHVTLIQAVGIPELPKHHMFIHLALGIRRFGNPRYYSCFADEHLNLTIKMIAQVAHRMRWQATIFNRIRLLPKCVADSLFA